MTNDERAAQVSALRLRILTLLRPNCDGLSPSAIITILHALGYSRLTADQLELELDYLVGKGWVTKSGRPLVPQLEFFRITAAGTDMLPVSEL